MLPTLTLVAGVYEDPELRFSQAGKAWVTVKTVVKDRKQVDGQWVDNDDSVWFVRVKAFGKLAENIAESVKRGDTIIAQGRLEHGKFQTQSGEDLETWDLLAEDVGLSMRFATYVREDAASLSRSPSRQPDPSEPVPF